MTESALRAPWDPHLCLEVEADALLWAHWEADSSLYHRGTGETHLLGPLPTELVCALQAGPLPLAALSERLARACDTEDSPAWREKIAGILADLAALEIVTPRTHDT